ncbi:MAG: PadR family transcriptional regulator [Brevundimonas sp.]|uniref:PadR family transcriptional regulator n=1 Tax=Brevundimonas sp. TaxID=1871086 RepID=UPI00391DC12D
MLHTLCVTHYARRGRVSGVSDELFESLRLELRRGSLSLAVLARLRVERYGYSLRTALAGDGVEMEESTLYPLLRRLEGQGLLTSEWREEEKRRKRFYRLSPAGEVMLARLLAEWRGISASLDRIFTEEEGAR